MAVDKSTYNRKIKVSQSTIDDIKKLGMTKALKLAKQNAGASQSGLVKEYQEATRRLYGDRRFAAATGSSSVRAKTADQARAQASPVRAKTADQARAGATKPKSTPKKNNNLGYKVAGGAAAVAALIASRGKATGLASKLSPTVAKALGGKALPKTVQGLKGVPESVKVGPKGSFGPTTAATAKAGKKLGTKGEYAMKATQDKARATIQSRMPAKAIKPRSTNTPAKPMPKTAKGRANYGKFGTRDEYLFEKNAPAPKMSRWDANAPKPRVTKKPKAK